MIVDTLPTITEIRACVTPDTAEEARVEMTGRDFVATMEVEEVAVEEVFDINVCLVHKPQIKSVMTNLLL